MNLVTDGIGACDPGGTVTVRALSDPAGATFIEISDTGRGIDSSIHSRIFDPFFTTKPIGRGTGFGLAICYGTISSHGGTINVASEPGRGARFTVRLPSLSPELVKA